MRLTNCFIGSFYSNRSALKLAPQNWQEAGCRLLGKSVSVVFANPEQCLNGRKPQLGCAARFNKKLIAIIFCSGDLWTDIETMIHEIEHLRIGHYYDLNLKRSGMRYIVMPPRDHPAHEKPERWVEDQTNKITLRVMGCFGRAWAELPNNYVCLEPDVRNWLLSHILMDCIGV